MIKKLEKYSCVFLLILSCFLFGYQNSFTIFFTYIPVLLLIKKTKINHVWIWGGFYGSISYLLYARWLFVYSKIAMFGVSFIYFFYYAIIFFVLKLSEKFYYKFRILLQVTIFVLFEYLKTTGYLGFSYGISGYTQFNNIYLIQIADIFGVWGVSAIIYLFNIVIFNIYFYFSKNKIYINNIELEKNNIIVYTFLLLLALISFYIYGIVKIKSIDSRDKIARKITVAAIQNNTDPWKCSFDNYRKDVETLISISDKALKENPAIDLIVWPETSVVPSIKSNYYKETDKRRYDLVLTLLNYINSKEAAFIIGNFNIENTDYLNSSFLFIPNENVLPPEPEIYSKIHLVPLSEYFPFEKQFPYIYKLLLDGDTHLWTPGKDYTVFDLNGFKFSTPICFEDTFGRDCKKFVKNGAKAFVNLSNDAWSKSKLCQKQHLQMAVFRSVENHVPSIRSTASGVTCIIDSCGRVVKMCNEFSEGFVIGAIPIL